MKKLTLKFLRLNKDAQIPLYVRPGDCAFDIYSVEKVTLGKGKILPIKTGIASEIPPGYFVSFRGRSGLAAKFGIDVFGGVIDSTYRGEWMVILANLGPKAYKIEKGERIAQGILQEIPAIKIVEVKKLSESVRGEKGFGSSGRK